MKSYVIAKREGTLTACVAPTLLVVFILVVALSFFGCSSQADIEPGEQPGGGEIQQLDGEGAVRIALDYSAGTGFTWVCSVDPRSVLQIAYQDTVDMAGDEPVSGGPIRDYVTLRAVNPGIAVVTCNLVREWEDEPAPAETQVFAFEVDQSLQITFLPDQSDYVIEPEQVFNS